MTDLYELDGDSIFYTNLARHSVFDFRVTSHGSRYTYISIKRGKILKARKECDLAGHAKLLLCKKRVHCVSYMDYLL